MEKETEMKMKELLKELYNQVVEDVPPEVGSQNLWDMLHEVECELGLRESRINL